MLPPQLETGLDDAVRGPARRERFVRKLGHEPAPAEFPGDAHRLAARLDQLEITERAFEHILRSIEPARGEVAGDDGIAGIEAHLHGEQGRSFAMRLHSAAALAIGDRECIDHGRRDRAP